AIIRSSCRPTATIRTRCVGGRRAYSDEACSGLDPTCAPGRRRQHAPMCDVACNIRRTIMTNIASRTRSRSAALVVGGLLVALVPLLPVPASADPSQAEVAGACKRTKNCWSEQQPGGVGIIGCSPHACFSCNGVTCHQLPKSAIKRPVVGTTRGGNSAGNASG